jgi:hypothetical protein
VSLIFLRLSFFPEWVNLIQRTFTRIRQEKEPPSSSASSVRSDFLIHLHTPSENVINIKTIPLETSYQSRSFLYPRIDLHPPLHDKSESQATILSDVVRPGSARQANVRSGSQRSNIRVKKDKSKKITVDDIIAMRRLEQSSAQGNRECTEEQSTKI